MSTTNPSPSPTEAPQKLSDLHEASKQKSFIDEIAKSHNLSDQEKKSFTEKYQKAIDELLKKYEGKKDVVIAEISDILKKFKESIQHEKNDDDDATEFSAQSPDTDKTDVDAEKKLGDKEIDEHIKQLSDKIEAKLNTQPTTPPENTPPTPTPQVIEKTLGELDIDPSKIPPLPNDYESKNKPSGLVNMVIKILDSIGLGFLANYLKMSTMGYKNEKQMESTKAAMNNLLSVKESPVSNILRLDDITEREYRQILANHGDVDFTIKENVEAAFLGKHADNPKYAKYHRIYKGIGEMAQNMGSTEEVGYDPVARMEELLDYSKRTDLTPEYNTHTTTPVVAPEEAPAPKTPEQEKEEKEKQKLSDIESAKAADKKVEDAENKTPKDTAEVKTAQEEREKMKQGIAEKIQGIYKKARTDLENINNKLLISGISDPEKTKLNEQKRQLEECIREIETEGAKLIKDIKKEPAELTDIKALEAVLIQQKVEDSYTNVTKLAQEKAGTIIGEKEEREKEDQGIKEEIKKAENQIQELKNIIGIDGSKALTKGEIITTNEKWKELEVLLSKIDYNSKGKEVRKDYENLKNNSDALQGKYKFKNVGTVKTDYDEEIQDIGVEKTSIDNTVFNRLIAVSPDQEVAYFYVSNLPNMFSGSGYLRLVLSDKDSQYSDTSAAFFPSEGKPTLEEEVKDISSIENDAWRDSFFTLELNGSGTFVDDNLDWKKDTKWKAKIQSLGLIVGD